MEVPLLVVVPRLVVPLPVDPVPVDPVLVVPLLVDLVPVDPVLPAQMYRLLRGQAETLGYAADHTVSALTDLVALVAR